MTGSEFCTKITQGQMMRFDDKIDLRTVILLGAIVLSSVVGAVRVIDTQREIQETALRSDKLNAEAHLEIVKRVSAIERVQLMQEGYNAAMAKIAAQGED